MPPAQLKKRAQATHRAKVPKDVEVAPRAILIHWVDSVRHSDGWDTQSEYVKGATYETLLHATLGYLIGESDHSLVIAQSMSLWTEYVEVSDVLQIPKAAILERKWVELPEMKQLVEDE